jgi:hypothetical protein
MTGQPIPGTGRRHFGHWLRRRRNISAKRGLLAAVGTLKGLKIPPNAWDDIKISALSDRTWKRFRRTRWKP